MALTDLAVSEVPTEEWVQFACALADLQAEYRKATIEAAGYRDDRRTHHDFAWRILAAAEAGDLVGVKRLAAELSRLLEPRGVV
jgi:hypothetical protein